MKECGWEKESSLLNDYNRTIGCIWGIIDYISSYLTLYHFFPL